MAPIIVLDRPLSLADLPRLYAAADVYVSASRGEGWGRPMLEAMACRLPVVATRWSGNLAFMNDENSLLLDIEGVRAVDHQAEFAFYRGHHWAEPSRAHLTEVLVRLAADPAMRRRLGARARSDVERRWQWKQVTQAMVDRVDALAGAAASACGFRRYDAPGIRGGVCLRPAAPRQLGRRFLCPPQPGGGQPRPRHPPGRRRDGQRDAAEPGGATVHPRHRGRGRADHSLPPTPGRPEQSRCGGAASLAARPDLDGVDALRPDPALGVRRHPLGLDPPDPAQRERGLVPEHVGQGVLRAQRGSRVEGRRRAPRCRHRPLHARRARLSAGHDQVAPAALRRRDHRAQGRRRPPAFVPRYIQRRRRRLPRGQGVRLRPRLQGLDDRRPVACCRRRSALGRGRADRRRAQRGARAHALPEL